MCVLHRSDKPSIHGIKILSFTTSGALGTCTSCTYVDTIRPQWRVVWKNEHLAGIYSKLYRIVSQQMYASWILVYIEVNGNNNRCLQVGLVCSEINYLYDISGPRSDVPFVSSRSFFYDHCREHSTFDRFLERTNQAQCFLHPSIKKWPFEVTSKNVDDYNWQRFFST